MKSSSRRNLLKNVGVGSVWVTPLIQSVLLPAHAETSSSYTYRNLDRTNGSESISVLVENGRATIRLKRFFDGGCNICGSDVEYESISNISGAVGTLNAVDFGCGVSAPSVLGTASIQGYTLGDLEIIVAITSSEIGNSSIVVPTDVSTDLGPFVCT
jgi:hypothetical protein